ncbi:MAG: hypothetical protein LBT63_03435 [Holosporaceae bacterium]|jgi:hypothetical protein|nr:hypothetical protein [Holosporaceae bacterium]
MLYTLITLFLDCWHSNPHSSVCASPYRHNDAAVPELRFHSLTDLLRKIPLAPGLVIECIQKNATKFNIVVLNSTNPDEIEKTSDEMMKEGVIFGTIRELTRLKALEYEEYSSGNVIFDILTEESFRSQR